MYFQNGTDTKLKQPWEMILILFLKCPKKSRNNFIKSSQNDKKYYRAIDIKNAVLL